MSGELREAQDKLDRATEEYDRLNDEWSAKYDAQQNDFRREKQVSRTGSQVP